MSSEFKTLEMAGTDPALRSALNEYLAYQHAKLIRQTLTGKLALLVSGIAILTFVLHFLPTTALVTTVLLASGMFVVATTNERKARRRLTDQLTSRHGR
jgi:hypothetical protein